VNPEPAESLHKLFQADYFKPQPGGDFRRLRDEFDRWRQPALARIAAVIQQYVPEPGRLLDVGCGTGALFRQFSASSGWRFFGVEPSLAAYRYAMESISERSDVELFNGYLEAAAYPTGFFDVVCLLEVIYYFPRLVPAIQEVTRVLKPDGVLLIEVPSLQYLLVRHTGLISQFLYGATCTLPASHLYYFSHESVKRLLAAHGFSIEKVELQPTSARPELLSRLLGLSFWQFARLIYRLTRGELNLGSRTLYIARHTDVDL